MIVIQSLKNRIYIFSLAVLLSLFAFSIPSASAFQTSAEQAVLMDYDTGMILFEKNAEEKMPTSSMSKVMTMYMVFEALKDSQISLDTTFPVSEKAWRKGGSKMFVEVGDNVRVEDLIRGVVIQSGNDATIVLAEGLAGSEEAFAEALTIKARALGMKNSQFMNASGWPDPEHYSTAMDLAILARNLIKEFPEYYDYFSQTEYTYHNISQKNRNPLLYRDIGVDGIKTGHTEAGGYGLMASGTHNDRRVILVVNGLEDEAARATESARMMEWGLKGFENITLFEQGDIVEYANIVLGEEARLPLTLEQDLNITIPLTVKNDLKVEAVYNEPLQAPVEKGQTVGMLHVDIPRVTTLKVPLVAAENVAELGLFAKAIAKARLMITGQ